MDPFKKYKKLFLACQYSVSEINRILLLSMLKIASNRARLVVQCISQCGAWMSMDEYLQTALAVLFSASWYTAFGKPRLLMKVKVRRKGYFSALYI